jgi:hypothetical protein
VSQLSRQCGSLNISQLYRPPWPVTGIYLLYFYFNWASKYEVFYISFLIDKKSVKTGECVASCSLEYGLSDGSITGTCRSRLDLLEVGRVGVHWVIVAQDRDTWRPLVGTVINLRVP